MAIIFLRFCEMTKQFPDEKILVDRQIDEWMDRGSNYCDSKGDHLLSIGNPSRYMCVHVWQKDNFTHTRDIKQVVKRFILMV
jgi:hypothetical protein